MTITYASVELVDDDVRSMKVWVIELSLSKETTDGAREKHLLQEVNLLTVRQKHCFLYQKRSNHNCYLPLSQNQNLIRNTCSIEIQSVPIETNFSPHTTKQNT